MTFIQAIRDKLTGKDLWSSAIPWLIIIALEIVATSMIPYTRKLIIDALTEYHWHYFLWAVGIGLTNSLILSGAQGFKTWVVQKTSLILRKAMLSTIKKRWTLKNGHSELINPCSRLNDDTRQATELFLSTATEIFISVCIVIGLLSSIVKWPVLFVAAIIYSAISIGLALLFRRPMIDSKYASINAEGQHRIALTKISMQQGDYSSKSKWVKVQDTYLKYIGICRNYKLFNAVQSALMYSLPFILMAPAFFNKEITLGDVTQGTLTFDLLVLNATIWVQLYPTITEAQTCFIRVNEMYDEVNSD